MRYRTVSLIIAISLSGACSDDGAPAPDGAAADLSASGDLASARGDGGASGCPSGYRTLSFVNACGDPVWFGGVGASIPCRTDGTLPCPSTSTCVAGVCNCAGSSDCGAGQACNPNNSQCFWTIPAPIDNGGSFRLAPSASATLCLAPRPGQTVQLSGNFFARTGCVVNGAGTLTCQTGNCATGTVDGGTGCLPGVGGTPPSTLAEFTLQDSFASPAAGNKDFYDVSIINGVNVPVSMAPIAGTYAAAAGDPYSCQTPGSAKASATGLSACSWTFTPGTIHGKDQTSLLRLVAPSTVTSAAQCPSGSTYLAAPNLCGCAADAQCSSSGLVCGLSLGVTGAASGLGQVCGSAIGEWSADQICGTGGASWKSPDGTLDCGASFPLNNGGGSTTLTALLLCPGGIASCSNDNPAPNSDCCGCATDAANPLASDWPSVLGLGSQCYADNPTWAAQVQPWLAFMKLACPTAYTYPYDDSSSTFTCLLNGTFGGVGYAITFCPR